MSGLTEDDFDEFGQWTGTCKECGTNHDGYPPDTVGALIAHSRVVARQHGGPEGAALLAMADGLETTVSTMRDQFLRDEGLID